MSNRWYKQFQYTLEQDTVTLFGNAVISGSTGSVAVSDTFGGGIASVTKESTAGQYTVKLTDSFSRLLAADARVVSASISGVANVQLLASPATLQASFKTSRSLTFQCVDYAGAAVNPPDGALLTLRLVLRRSAVGPWDR